MGDQDQKTHEATPQRRQEATKKGQVPYSAELVHGTLMLVGGVSLWLGGALSDGLKLTVRNGLTEIATELNAVDVRMLAIRGLYAVGSTVCPLLVVVLLVVVVVSVAQTGFNVSLPAIAPDASRLSPAKGLQRIWSSRTLMRTLTAILKGSVIVGVALVVVRGRYYPIAAAGRGTLPMAVRNAWDTAMAITVSAAGAMLMVGVLDVLYQRWKHEQDLKMTDQEVKEDHKQQEGDPLVRARLRRLQRERANNDMLRDIPGSTVVVTNPTHIAVVLKYDRALMPAPRVVAMGVDALAVRIRALAQEHGVPMVEDKPLARTLYASVQVGDEIPIPLYEAVAALLSALLKR